MEKYESCIIVFVVLLSVFVRWKVAIKENIRIIDHMFGIRIPDYSKPTIKSKK